MTASSLICTADHGAVRLLTLNRPEVLNAFSVAAFDAVADALVAASDDPAVSVLVLTGAGRAFSSGIDLFELQDRSRGPNPPGGHSFDSFVEGMLSFRKPLLAAVNGIAIGIGATLLALVDIVLMSEGARVKTPFTSLGLVPEAASSYALPALMGHQQAAWMLLSSAWLSAEECRDAGLAWRVCTDEELLPLALRHAQVIAAHSQESLIETKRLLMQARLADLRAAHQRERTAMAALLQGPVSKAAVARFGQASRGGPDRS